MRSYRASALAFEPVFAWLRTHTTSSRPPYRERAIERQVCPHIIGGIPPHAVDEVFPIVRAGKEFVRIEGLAE